MRPCDKHLLKQGHRAASIHIQVANGEVLLAASSGALQGDGIASDLSLEQYPVNQKHIDTFVTTYAVDLAVKALATTAHGLPKTAVALDDMDASLASGRLAQSRPKQDVVVHFAGVERQDAGNLHWRSGVGGQNGSTSALPG